MDKSSCSWFRVRKNSGQLIMH